MFPGIKALGRRLGHALTALWMRLHVRWTPPSRTLVRAAYLLLGFLGLGLACGLWIYLNRPFVRHMLAHWTGEDELVEQIKGVGALAYLRLTQSPPRTDPYVPIAHTGVSPYGVNTFLEQEVDPAQIERSLALISDAGFHWIRQEFPWEDIEISAKGDYWDHLWNKSAWEKYDRIVDLAESYGLKVIARLDNPPAWSRAIGDAPGWSLAPPDDFEDFGDFCYTVVSRYKGRIRYYQIWNEPNIYPEWGDQPADPAAYVELLKIGYRRAKEADPDCVVIAAGLAQTIEEAPPEFGPRNVSDLLYLEKMYEAGAQGHFDIMGAQVYGLWTGPYDRRASRDRTNFSRAQLLREIMVSHGDGDKPIWATEVGWNTVPDDFQGFPAYGRVTPEKQAIYAIEAYRRAAREWPWMGVMNYWFFRRPSEAEKDQAWYYFRMVEPDMTPLPVYHAMAWLMNRVQYDGGPPAVPIGYHQQDHWALHYEGPWQHVRDDASVLGAYAEGSQDARLDFVFEGTDLALVLRDAPPNQVVRQLAGLRVSIDGRELQPHHLAPRVGSWQADALSGRGSTAAISSQSDSIAVPIARGLRDEPHRASLYVAEGTLALDGLIVWRSSPSWPLLLLLGAIAVPILASLGIVREKPQAGAKSPVALSQGEPR